MQNAHEMPVTVSEKINEFIQKRRKPLFISVAAVLLILVICIAGISLMDVFRERAITEVEGLNTRYGTLSSITDTGDSERAQLLEDLEVFAQKNSGVIFPSYAGGRAWAIIGTIYGEQEQWAQAETAWTNAAQVARKTYLAPIAFFNAGAAAEEQGRTEAAIAHYANSISPDFPASPRAQFAIGRLRESLHDRSAAMEAYRAVISGWPQDSAWVNLAHSRIIALEMPGNE